LTSRLQQIENRFKTKVVIRSTSGVTFTPEGKYLVQCAQNMLKQMHTIENDVESFSKEMQGTINIGSSVLFIRYKLPDLLKGFSEKYPLVQYNIHTDLSRNIVDKMINNDIDIGFIRGEYDWLDKKELLIEEDMYVVAKNKFTLKDLPKMRRIDYFSNRSLKVLIEKWWKENFDIAPQITVIIDKADSCISFVENGLGYAVIPACALRDMKNVYKIKMFNKLQKPLYRKTWMLYREGSLNRRLIKEFVEFVQVWKLKQN